MFYQLLIGRLKFIQEVVGTWDSYLSHIDEQAVTPLNNYIALFPKYKAGFIINYLSMHCKLIVINKLFAR